jgi:hypothetical protein
MNVLAPDSVSSAAAGETEVLVNVFSGSERSSVEMRLGMDGDWIPLARVDRPDPFFLAEKRREEETEPQPARPLPPADPSRHLWAGSLPADPARGTLVLEVRTTDLFGQTFSAKRIIRIE